MVSIFLYQEKILCVKILYIKILQMVYLLHFNIELLHSVQTPNESLPLVYTYVQKLCQTNYCLLQFLFSALI